jgi:hypothetical protein
MMVTWLGGAAVWGMAGVGVAGALAQTAPPYTGTPVTPLLAKVPPPLPV